MVLLNISDTAVATSAMVIKDMRARSIRSMALIILSRFVLILHRSIMSVAAPMESRQIESVTRPVNTVVVILAAIMLASASTRGIMAGTGRAAAVCTRVCVTHGNALAR
jgi:hypothetical protein